MPRSNADPTPFIRRAEFALRLAYWSPLGVWGFAVHDANLGRLDHAWPHLLVWFAPAALAALLGISAIACGARLRRGKDALRTGFAAAVVACATLAAGLPTAQALDDTRRHWPSPGRGTACLSNVKQLSLALLMYEQDYDGWTPATGGWNDGLFPYIKNPRVFVCPDAANQEVPSYSLNRRACHVNVGELADTEQTVMVFEGGEGADLVGGPGTLADPPRHHEHNTIGSVDGHAKQLTLAAARECVWRPRLVTKHKSDAKRP